MSDISQSDGFVLRTIKSKIGKPPQKKCPLYLGRKFPFEFGNSSLNKCPRPTWQTFRQPHHPETKYRKAEKVTV